MGPSVTLSTSVSTSVSVVAALRGTSADPICRNFVLRLQFLPSHPHSRRLFQSPPLPAQQSLVRKKTTCGGSSTSQSANGRRHAIVTGGNSGIGKAIALDLARQGMAVTLCCRNEDKGKAAAEEISSATSNPSIRSMRLDLASLQSVRQFVVDYKQLNIPLHVLVNNAGIMACPQGYTEDGFELQIGVNHFGHFLLTSLLIDKLVASASIKSKSRVVVLASAAENFGRIDFNDLNYKGGREYNNWGAYGQSKLSNCLFSYELAKRSRQLQLPITSNSMHPGIVNTELVRYVLPEITRNRSVWVERFLRFFGLRTPAEGASTAVFLASSPEVENLSGLYFEDSKPRSPSRKATDAQLASKLWDVSVLETGASSVLEELGLNKRSVILS